MDQVRSAADEAGQGHIFGAWSTMSAAGRTELESDLQAIDFAYVNSIFKASTAPQGEPRPP